MVNFQDPEVIAQDICAYAFAAGHAISGRHLNPYFNSDSREALERRGRYLPVSLAPSRSLALS
jgi:hypothetical protein